MSDKNAERRQRILRRRDGLRSEWGETRTLRVPYEDDEYGFGGRGMSAPAQYHLLPQRAIPWCVTHNNEATGRDSKHCWHWEHSADPTDCVISRGGSDHRWWEDVDE